jgi:hypothetical protein
MTPRARVLAFGSAAALIVVGGISAAVIGGYTGEIVGLTLSTLGLGAVVLLVFLEIGLSEDRDRAKEEAQRPKQATPRDNPPRRRRPRRPI